MKMARVGVPSSRSHGPSFLSRVQPRLPIDDQASDCQDAQPTGQSLLGSDCSWYAATRKQDARQEGKLDAIGLLLLNPVATESILRDDESADRPCPALAEAGRTNQRSNGQACGDARH